MTVIGAMQTLLDERELNILPITFWLLCPLGCRSLHKIAENSPDGCSEPKEDIESPILDADLCQERVSRTSSFQRISFLDGHLRNLFSEFPGRLPDLRAKKT